MMVRRLLSLDYVLYHPDAPWMPTEHEQATALTAVAGAPAQLREYLCQRRRSLVLVILAGLWPTVTTIFDV